MKVGLISDVHGNLPALQQALTEIAKEDVQRVIFLGDAAGSLGWNDEVCSLLKLVADIAVFGNHDANVMPRFAGGNQALSLEYNVVMHTLSDENHRWLCSLPEKEEVQLGGHKTAIAHANPLERPYHGFPADNYLDPRHFTTAGSKMGSTEIMFTGHTHDAHALKLDKFDGQSGLIVNPGSVGVPWDKPAEYAIVDVTTLDAELRTVEYDTERNIEKFKELGLDGWRE